MASGWLAQLQDELTSHLEDALSQCDFSSGSVEEVRLECTTNDFVGGDRCSTGFREVVFFCCHSKWWMQSVILRCIGL